MFYEHKFEELIPVVNTYVELVDQIYGPDSSDMFRALQLLEDAYHNSGQMSESRSIVHQLLSIIWSWPHYIAPEEAASALRTIALRHVDWHSYDIAESLYHRCLDIYESINGPEHTNVAMILTALANLYIELDQYDQAELLLNRALSIFENPKDDVWPQDAGMSLILAHLSQIHVTQGRFGKATRILERAIKLIEQGQHPEYFKKSTIGSHLANLGGIFVDQGRFSEAESVYTRALKIQEQVWGPEHLRTAGVAEHIATLYTSQGRYAEGELFYKRALRARKRVLGSNHPDTGAVLYGLSFLYQYQGMYSEGLKQIRQSSRILRQLFSADRIKTSKSRLAVESSYRLNFLQHADLALHPLQQGSRVELEAEAFEALQMASSSSAASAIGRMADRFASTDDQMASVIRERQDVLAYYKKLGADLISVLSNSAEAQNLQRVVQIRDNLKSVGAHLLELAESIEKQFPAYAELTSRDPLSLVETRDLLHQDEGLLTFIRSVDGNRTHVFAISHDQSTAYTVELGRDELKDMVDKLRAGVDMSGVRALSDLPVFDTRIAYELYQRLLSPADHVLSEVKHLFVVPDGPLQSLPIGILVTKPPRTAPEQLSDYQGIPWLYKDHAITTLPAVASLRALRAFIKNTNATKPFIGFGDPVLGDEAGQNRGLELSAFYRGSLADIEEVRKLGRLPNTAQELRTLAEYLGADDSKIFLREKATETNVKTLPLHDNKVVAFSTHGLISGELKGLAEPALVLTPPHEATTADDGLLTASEVAQLKLDADWVILSACNTAAGDKPGAEGLSGLAKAFFFAGARTLLVSHWPVESGSATLLVTNMFNAIKNNPAIGRAEALRQSMMQLASDKSKPFNAHPLFWAPFVVVGEGGG